MPTTDAPNICDQSMVNSVINEQIAQLASGSITVVGHSPHHPKVKDLSSNFKSLVIILALE